MRNIKKVIYAPLICVLVACGQTKSQNLDNQQEKLTSPAPVVVEETQKNDLVNTKPITSFPFIACENEKSPIQTQPVPVVRDVTDAFDLKFTLSSTPKGVMINIMNSKCGDGHFLNILWGQSKTPFYAANDSDAGPTFYLDSEEGRITIGQRNICAAQDNCFFSAKEKSDGLVHVDFYLKDSKKILWSAKVETRETPIIGLDAALIIRGLSDFPR